MSKKTSGRTVAELTAAPYNPREIDAEGLEMLGDSMTELGDLSGIVFNRRTERLVGGHQRVRNMPEGAEITIEQTYDPPTQTGTVAEGYIEVAGERWTYREVDVDETTEMVMNVRANKEAGRFVPKKLRPILSHLDANGASMGLTGFRYRELQAFIDEPREDREKVADPPKKAKSKPGKIYELGEHRLICGDATDPATFEKLLGEEKAQCIWTDPPYGVNYVGGTEDRLTLEGDQPGVADALLRDTLLALQSFVVENCPYYVCSPGGGLQGLRFRQAIIDAEWRLHQTLVWVKSSLVVGHSDYHYQHEDVLFGWAPGHEDVLYGWAPGEGRVGRGHAGWFGDNAQSSVFQVPKPQSNPDHPTPKPVALIEPMILNSTERGGIVLDMFAGSGSTLIAAHDAGRVCRAVELDPRYCDVIRRRFAEHTGQEDLAP